jgi:hypothetical protein
MFTRPFFGSFETVGFHYPAHVVKPMPGAQERRHLFLPQGRIGWPRG